MLWVWMMSGRTISRGKRPPHCRFSDGWELVNSGKPRAWGLTSFDYVAAWYQFFRKFVPRHPKNVCRTREKFLYLSRAGKRACRDLYLRKRFCFIPVIRNSGKILQYGDKRFKRSCLVVYIYGIYNLAWGVVYSNTILSRTAGLPEPLITR